MLMAPSVSQLGSTDTMNDSGVVANDVDRHGVGRDNDPRLSCIRPRRNVTRTFAPKGSVKVIIVDSFEEV
jgi:hypothetical protein